MGMIPQGHCNEVTVTLPLSDKRLSDEYRTAINKRCRIWYCLLLWMQHDAGMCEIANTLFHRDGAGTGARAGDPRTLLITGIPWKIYSTYKVDLFSVHEVALINYGTWWWKVVSKYGQRGGAKNERAWWCQLKRKVISEAERVYLFFLPQTFFALKKCIDGSWTITAGIKRVNGTTVISWWLWIYKKWNSSNHTYDICK